MKLIIIFGLSILTFMITFTGCYLDFNGSGSPRMKFETTVDLQNSFGQAVLFTAQTSNGFIEVQGIEDSVCSITAKITGRAATELRAQELAHATKLSLRQENQTLKTVIDKPKLISNESVSVSLTVRIPRNKAIKLNTSNGRITVSSMDRSVSISTSNGKVEINNVAGPIEARTSNGKILLENIPGSLNARTSNGAIECRNIAGAIHASTSNGSVNIEYAKEAPADTDVHITTSNGSIRLTLPKEYSASAVVQTSLGKIHTDRPVTTSGRIDKTLRGTFGDGAFAKLYLKTTNGSIYIR